MFRQRNLYLKQYLALLLACFVLLGFSRAANAEGLSIGVAPVWWQYQESSERRTGFVATPFSSSVSGVSLGLNVGNDVVIGNGLSFESSWSVLLPIGQQTESWNLATGVQTDRFQVLESELKMALLQDFDSVQVGAWITYMNHTQERKQFTLNGAITPVVGEPITETVQVLWLGLMLKSESAEGLAISLDAGVPASVRTTNALVAGEFTKRSGFRLGADVEWVLPHEDDDSHWSLNLVYQYRELGNDLKATALWPKNTWQSLSLSTTFTW